MKNIDPSSFRKWSCPSLALLIVLCGSCLNSEKLVEKTAPILLQPSSKISLQNSWTHFNRSTPALIQMAESMLASSPKNPSLLSFLVKANAAYGFLIYDTLDIERRLTGSPLAEIFEARAESFDKSLRYGLKYLTRNAPLAKGKKISRHLEALLKEVRKLPLSEQDEVIETSFYLGLSWLMHIQSSPKRIGQLASARKLIEFSCEQKPDLGQGLCPIVQGIFELSKSKQLKTDRTPGRKILRQALVDYPQNLLVPVMLMEYSSIAFQDSQEFDQLMSEYGKKILTSTYGSSSKTLLPPDPWKLYTSTAAKRLRLLLTHRNSVDPKKHP